MSINRPEDLIPRHMIPELLRIAAVRRDWLTVKPLGDVTYSVRATVSSPFLHRTLSAPDLFTLYSQTVCLADGMKVFRPTVEQCEAMENIEVRIPMADYEQPYPALVIDLPTGRYHPFTAVLICKTDLGIPLVTCWLRSWNYQDDINTVVGKADCPMEESLMRYQDDVSKPHATLATLANRVAVNSALALVNFGCHADFLRPKEVDRDRVYARERSERGERARGRLRSHPKLLSLSHDVKLHVPAEAGAGHGEPTGREVATHWRRGHWVRQACGPGRSERKLQLRKPVLVRADRLEGGAAGTVVYHS